jgi:hypothetical protein
MAMTGGRAERDAYCAEIRDLAWELACVQGALSEIETCWRRSGQPAGRLLLRLRDAAREIEADARSLEAGGLGQPCGPLAEVAKRFHALRQGIAGARAMTCGPGAIGAGDHLLWESVEGAMDRAGSRLLCLIVHLVRVTGWSLDSVAGPGASPRQVVLTITLGQGTAHAPAA